MFGKITTYPVTSGQLNWASSPGLEFLQSPAVALILGTFLFYFLYMVPYLGFVAWGFSGLFGLGAVVLAAVGQFRSERPKPAAPIHLGSPLW